MLSLGSIIYAILLLINAMAVLSEDRFLARSECTVVIDALLLKVSALY